jgi:ketosteroid isomerase-like protein
VEIVCGSKDAKTLKRNEPRGDFHTPASKQYQRILFFFARQEGCVKIFRMIPRTLVYLLWVLPLMAADSPEVQVANAEKAMAAARAAKDVAALERLTADDFIWVRAGGAMTDKKELLEEMRAGRLDTYSPDGDQRIRVYGNTAVVTGARTLNEATGTARIVVTNVWVKHGNEWQRVSSHTTRIAPAAK